LQKKGSRKRDAGRCVDDKKLFVGQGGLLGGHPFIFGHEAGKRPYYANRGLSKR